MKTKKKKYIYIYILKSIFKKCKKKILLKKGIKQKY